MVKFLLLFVFVPILFGERPFSEWNTTTLKNAEGHENIYFSPPQCCQLCGKASDEWKQFSYAAGRCVRSNLKFIPHTVDQKEENLLPLIPEEFRQRCCFFCGSFPGDYEYVPYNSSSAFCRLNDKLRLNTVATSFGCIGCRSLVETTRSLLDYGEETVRDNLYAYCDDTLIFRAVCKRLVESQLEAILYFLKHHLDAVTICSHFLHFCDVTLPHDSLVQLGARARTTILTIEDGDPQQIGALLDLPEINSYNIDEYIGDDETEAGVDKTIKFLAMYSLIANKRNCLVCNSPMTLTKDKARADKYMWRCNECRRQGVADNRKVSLRHGSFFDDSRIGLATLLRLAAMWSTNPAENYDNVAKALKISKSTVVDYYNVFRDVTQHWFERTARHQQLGGVGKIVEIDESKFFKAKYNRGRMLTRTYDWVFGMIERGTHRMAFFTVAKRDAATLLPLIQQYIAPGSVVVSDVGEPTEPSPIYSNSTTI